jgi:hypothetical protein
MTLIFRSLRQWPDQSFLSGTRHQMNQAKTFRGPARIPRLSVACKLFYFRASGAASAEKFRYSHVALKNNQFDSSLSIKTFTRYVGKRTMQRSGKEEGLPPCRSDSPLGSTHTHCRVPGGTGDQRSPGSTLETGTCESSSSVKAKGDRRCQVYGDPPGVCMPALGWKK